MRERVKQWRQKVTSFLEKHIKPQSIQMTIALSFTIVSVISMGILGISLYNRFVNKMEDMTTQSAEQLLNQTAINLESYLRNMRRISDAMYYSVIKDKDLATDSLDEEMNLLYEANKDNLISIACYTNDGRLVAAAPVATEKNNLDIVDQEWFTEATGQMENVHFSTPHVQNLFDDPSYRYYWVVSLSQAVELTSGGNSTLGVLLVDMNYSSIEQLLTKANTDNASEYVYLMDGSGELIYHPKQKLIYGPGQVEALIDQNPEISAQLSLWSQRGSDVIRGDLLVVPIGKSLLYVQPLYLKAEKGELPELKRVIVSTGGRVAWSDSFGAALEKLMGQKVTTSTGTKTEPASSAPESPAPAGGLNIKALAEEAQQLYDAAQSAQRNGDWAGYGEKIKRLGDVLGRMKEMGD